MSKTETTLVTGAAGFIASHLIEDLLRAGTAVVGLDNFDPFYPRAVKEQNLLHLNAIARETGTFFKFFELSINDLSATSLIDFEFKRVLHLAAKSGVRPSLTEPESYILCNVLGTLKVLEFCRQRNISELLLGSSSSVYGNSTPVPFREDAIADRPISPYAASKRSGEHYCFTYSHLYGIKIAALRFFTVYGPRQRPDLAIHKFAKLIYSGSPITLFGDGTTSRDYTYVSDILAGIKGAINWTANSPKGSYEVFNLGGSESTQLLHLVHLLEESLYIKAKIEWLPTQAGDVEKTFADISKSKKYLEYSPKVTIRQGIENFSKWFLESQTNK